MSLYLFGCKRDVFFAIGACVVCLPVVAVEQYFCLRVISLLHARIGHRDYEFFSHFVNNVYAF